MPIERTNFEDIDEKDLQDLLDAGVPEGLKFDYKREVYGGSDADKKEFLKDISSFANSDGGHLVLGMDEDGGVPSAINGLPGIDIDSEILRMENLIRSSLEPRVVGIRIKGVALSNGESAVVARVPKSWNPPHRVSYKNSNRFYVRNSAGVHECSVEELRRLFGVSMEFNERVRQYREERLQRIASGQACVPIEHGGRLILHIVPMSAFGGAQVSPIAAYNSHQKFRPLGAENFSPRFNFDGFINVCAGERIHGYTQVFRNGVIEATKAAVINEWRGTNVLPALPNMEYLFEALQTYLSGLDELGVSPPVVVMVTFTAVNGAYLAVSSTPHFDDQEVIRQETLPLPEIVIDDYGSEEDYHQAMRPAFDALWNAAGYASCHFFDDEGRWAPPR